MKRSSIGYVTSSAYPGLARRAKRLSEYEGFSSHANAVSEIRDGLLLLTANCMEPCHANGFAYFLGIAVTMYYDDHETAHVHVRYQGFGRGSAIVRGRIMDGRLLPVTVTRIM